MGIKISRKGHRTRENYVKDKLLSSIDHRLFPAFKMFKNSIAPLRHCVRLKYFTQRRQDVRKF